MYITIFFNFLLYLKKCNLLPKSFNKFQKKKFKVNQSVASVFTRSCIFVGGTREIKSCRCCRSAGANDILTFFGVTLINIKISEWVFTVFSHSLNIMFLALILFLFTLLLLLIRLYQVLPLNKSKISLTRSKKSKPPFKTCIVLGSGNLSIP